MVCRLISITMYKRAGIQHKVQVGMCVHQRFKSVCASVQLDQGLSFPPEETLPPWLHMKCPSKTLISLCICTGWSESLMGAYANFSFMLGTSWNNVYFLMYFHISLLWFWKYFTHISTAMRQYAEQGFSCLASSHHARIQEFSSGGVQVSLTKTALTTFFFFFLVLSLFYRSQMVNFKEIYHFSRFQRVPTFSRGVKLFPGGSNCLILIETHITCDFPRGVQTPCPPLWIRTCKSCSFNHIALKWQ